MVADQHYAALRVSYTARHVGTVIVYDGAAWPVAAYPATGQQHTVSLAHRVTTQDGLVLGHRVALLGSTGKVPFRFLASDSTRYRWAQRRALSAAQREIARAYQQGRPDHPYHLCVPGHYQCRTHR